jgi:hypothetical protein
MWPQSKLQFEYTGSKIYFDELEFNLFVAEGIINFILGKTL